NNNVVTENRFGLGYTRVMRILSEILEYIKKHPRFNKDNAINILFIEEPEVYMHPQLQRLFMTNITILVDEFMKNDDSGEDINLNTQLILSTHSNHILNSKIELNHSFDNICYLYLKKHPIVVNIKNEDIITISDKEPNNTLKYMIKYLKNNMENLF